MYMIDYVSAYAGDIHPNMGIRINLSSSLVFAIKRLAAKQWTVMINLRNVGECLKWLFLYYRYKEVQ